MKKILGFIGATLYTAVKAYALYQFAFWVTPWFMSQKAWFLIMFWVVIATPLFLLVMSILNLVYGIPVRIMAESTSARVIPTILLACAGVFGCMLPWSLDVDYGDTLKICYAVTNTIAIAAIFIAAIIAVWMFRREKEFE